MGATAHYVTEVLGEGLIIEQDVVRVGRGVDRLKHDLSAAGVEIVVDVRLTPLSRKPGLSKTKLAETLRQAAIGYVHLPQLGNPRDNRDAYRNAEPHTTSTARLRPTPDLVRPGATGHGADRVAADTGTAWHHARRWEPKRPRLRLFSIAGRIARHARRTRLRLAAHAPWAALLTTALTRLQPD